MKKTATIMFAALGLMACREQPQQTDETVSGDEVAQALEDAATQSGPAAQDVLEDAADQARERDAMQPVDEPGSFAQDAVQRAADAEARREMEEAPRRPE